MKCGEMTAIAARVRSERRARRRQRKGGMLRRGEEAIRGVWEAWCGERGRQEGMEGRYERGASRTDERVA